MRSNTERPSKILSNSLNNANYAQDKDWDPKIFCQSLEIKLGYVPLYRASSRALEIIGIMVNRKKKSEKVLIFFSSLIVMGESWDFFKLHSEKFDLVVTECSIGIFVAKTIK